MAAGIRVCYPISYNVTGFLKSEAG